MTAIGISGTADPDQIAAVLALLARSPALRPSRGISSWRAGRRAALAGRAPGSRQTLSS